MAVTASHRVRHARNAARPEITIGSCMKCFGLSLTLASATLFHGVAWSAQESAPALMTPTPGALNATAPSTDGMRGSDLLKRFDQNGDGKIDDDERAEAKEAMMKEQIDRQMARVTASQATPEQLRQRALEFFDEDRDGRLNEAERAALQKFVETRGADGSPAGRVAWREELLKRVDKNANGRLDPDEIAAVRAYLDAGPVDAPAKAALTPEFQGLEPVLRAALEANPEQRARFDLNADWRIDDQEWREARRHIGRQLLGGEGEVMRVDPARLDAVAAEVARRREVREKAVQKLETTK